MRLLISLVAVGVQVYLADALATKPGSAGQAKVSANAKPKPSEPSSGLPQDYKKLLRDVKNEVDQLKKPKSQTPLAPLMQAPTECSFIGDLISAKLTPRCCTSVQVITQHKLSEYGLAKNCNSDWECEADGQTPSQSFEAKSLSELCGEPGCLPRITKALKSNWKTAAGANQMSQICSKLGNMGGGAKASRISGLLHQADDPAAVARAKARDAKKASANDCQKDICSVKAEKEKLCEVTRDKDDKCYDTCCSTGMQCFPSEAKVNMEGVGAVPLGTVKVGDRILVERSGQLVHEPVLAFLHAVRKGSGDEMPYLTVTHGRGEFRASSTHLVFVLSKDKGRVSKTVNELEIGDQLLVASSISEIPLVSSRVVGIHRSSGTLGMFAPLTASGTIIIDGVVASNYASPSHNKHLSHHYAHAFLFPVRVYHQLGVAKLLKPVWAWLCSSGHTSDKHWYCQGDGLDRGNTNDAEDMHPFLAVLYKRFKVDGFLQAKA